jgi:hypothetical protein
VMLKGIGSHVTNDPGKKVNRVHAHRSGNHHDLDNPNATLGSFDPRNVVFGLAQPRTQNGLMYPCLFAHRTQILDDAAIRFRSERIGHPFAMVAARSYTILVSLSG